MDEFISNFLEFVTLNKKESNNDLIEILGLLHPDKTDMSDKHFSCFSMETEVSR